jgi:hypothetical protein
MSRKHHNSQPLPIQGFNPATEQEINLRAQAMAQDIAAQAINNKRQVQFETIILQLVMDEVKGLGYDRDEHVVDICKKAQLTAKLILENAFAIHEQQPEDEPSAIIQEG